VWPRIKCVNFLVASGSVFTNMSVKFVGSCKCTLLPCCPVRLLFDCTCYIIATYTNIMNELTNEYLIECLLLRAV